MAGIIQLSDLGLYPKIDYAGVGWLVSPMIMLDRSNLFHNIDPLIARLLLLAFIRVIRG